GDILSIPSQVLGLELRVLSDCRLRFFDSVSGEYLRSPEESEQGRIQERMRAEQERMRAEQEQLRAEQERIRAEQERQRAKQEQLRAEQAEQELEQLRNLLRERGINPDDWST
ncbi:Uma2 family endonuclease, partial [Spirulina subsalsa FACHB-351]|nr:Uma2 family endonuclease [Spirulina subsalsa FACHB-351]